MSTSRPLRVPECVVGLTLVLPCACFDPMAVDTTEGSGSETGSTSVSAMTNTGSDQTSTADESGTSTATSAGPGCGNGIVEGLEQCDLGSGNSDNAGCTPACELAVCGDGLVYIGEEDCDDGSNGDPDDGCTDDCTTPACGDGYLQASLGEACDGADFGDQTCEGLGWSGGALTCVDCQLDESTCVGCGDGELEPGELCDDGNTRGGDGCEADCTFTQGVARLSSQWYASCASFYDGRLRCWGYNVYGQLGYGNVNSVGDNEPADFYGDVSLGADVLVPATGTNFSCAVIVDGTARCWGGANEGRLGYADANDIGDDELPSAAFAALPGGGAISVGGTVSQLATGRGHTCALLDDGSVRCWGAGVLGQTGHGNTDNVGDDELPSDVPPVSVGGTVTQIAAGWDHTCALLDGGTVRCWGQGASGRLGYGNTNNIGDNELPATAGDIPLTNDGTAVVQIDAGETHNCALFETGAVKCWGNGAQGQLGYGNTQTIGDDETPDTVGYVDVGGVVTQIVLGNAHSCALLEGGTIRCWGDGASGRLGYGNTIDIGDDETPAAAGDIDIGGTVTQIQAGNLFTCALLDTHQVRCFGDSQFGQLGYGNSQAIGDNEAPSTAGNVPLWP